MSDTQSPQIVHFSTSLSGGAGIACANLHIQLMKAGIDSKIVTLDKSGGVQNVQRISRNILNQFLGPLVSAVNKKVNEQSYFSVLSNNTVSRAILKNLGGPDKTILHIHNWFNLSNFRMFNELADEGYKFVFTMHDQRIFTGGCHYSLDCRDFICGCQNCPRVNRVFRSQIRNNAVEQRAFFASYKNQIKIVSPSIWMMEEARSGQILGGLEVRTIGNYIDVKNLAKKAGISQRLPIRLGVASMQPFSFIKGGVFVREIRNALELDSRFKLSFLSDVMSSNRSVDSFWSSIDYLLVPSVQDNSPNVIHEAKIYGIPVIASAVGGIPELLNSQLDISIGKSESAVELLSRILIHFESRDAHKTQDVLFMSKRNEVITSIIALYSELFNPLLPTI